MSASHVALHVCVLNCVYFLLFGAHIGGDVEHLGLDGLYVCKRSESLVVAGVVLVTACQRRVLSTHGQQPRAGVIAVECVDIESGRLREPVVKHQVVLLVERAFQALVVKPEHRGPHSLLFRQRQRGVAHECGDARGKRVHGRIEGLAHSRGDFTLGQPLGYERFHLRVVELAVKIVYAFQAGLRTLARALRVHGFLHHTCLVERRHKRAAQQIIGHAFASQFKAGYARSHHRQTGGIRHHPREAVGEIFYHHP